MDRTCVSTGALRKPAVPRRLNAPTPNVGDRRGGNPATNGCPSCTLLRPAGRHAMVVAHFFESGQRRRLRWGRVESAPLMAGAVALASTGYIAAIDEKAGRATSARPGRPGSHSVSGIAHGDSSRAEYARRKVESSFWSGAGSQPSCGRGDRL